MRPVLLMVALGAAILCALSCDSGGPAADGSGGAGDQGALDDFACGPRNPATPVDEITCRLVPEGVAVLAFGADSRWLVGAFYSSFDLGREETWYSGGMARVQNPDSVPAVAAQCLDADSRYTPDPCEIELLLIERGTVETVGAAGAASEVEVGSHVRLRVMCPDGLYSPSGDDYGARHYDITPSEFVLEARDCTVGD